MTGTVSLIKVPTEIQMWVEMDDAGRRFLRFGNKACTCTYYSGAPFGPGRVVEFGHKPCGKCNGTGRRGNGQCRGCKVESYLTRTRPVGTVTDYDAPIDAGPHEVCGGTGVVAADHSDYVPKSLLPLLAELIPVRVYAADRELSAGESLLGMVPGGSDAWGGVWGSGAVVDYGRSWAAWHADPGAFGAKIAQEYFAESHQACSLIVKGTGELIDHLGILLARGGYSRQGIAPEVADRTGRRIHTVGT